MDEVIWIELLPRHREHAMRERLGGNAFTIGRAWDNDIVLDDAHVAAHHLHAAALELGGDVLPVRPLTRREPLHDRVEQVDQVVALLAPLIRDCLAEPAQLA